MSVVYSIQEMCKYVCVCVFRGKFGVVSKVLKACGYLSILSIISP